MKAKSILVVRESSVRIKFKKEGVWYTAYATLPNDEELEAVGFSRKEALDDFLEMLKETPFRLKETK